MSLWSKQTKIYLLKLSISYECMQRMIQMFIKARGIKTCSLCIAPNNKCPKIFFSFQPIKFTLLNPISCSQSFSFTNVRYVSILRPLHFNTCQIDCCLSNNYWKLLFYHISFQPLKILHTSFNHTEHPKDIIFLSNMNWAKQNSW